MSQSPTMAGTFGERRNVYGKELLLRMYSKSSTEMHVNKNLIEMEEKGRAKLPLNKD